MNILVTGGAGFIGSHVVDKCLSEGHRVIVIDDLSTGKVENVNPQAIFHKLDLRSADLAVIFAREAIDIVIHHAAQMDVRRSVEDPVFDASVNILGSINLLEAARRNRVRKVVFASTGGAIYGEQDYFPADESHPLRPLSPYGISKLAVEKYLYFYYRVYGLTFVALRYANVYGPRQNSEGEAGVIAIFTRKLLHGEQPVINGDGNQTRDYVYVSDVVRANMLAVHHPSPDFFNVGTGKETTVNTLFDSLRKLIGSALKPVHGPAKKGEQLRSVLSYEHMRGSCNWEPLVRLDEGLQKTVEFFRREKTR